jgi:hypothetical protein
MIFLLFCGCTHNLPPELKFEPIQLVPKPDSTKEIHNIKITYILPNNLENPENSINGIRFIEYDIDARGKGTKIERLYYEANLEKLKIERRTDNGVAGSGIITQVNISTTSTPDKKIVTFIPKTQRTYQQGLVLPFLVPDFDLEDYLTSGIILFNFEINSDYPPEAVSANLQRLLGDKIKKTYIIDNKDERFELKITIYPYRHNQSKLAVITKLFNKKSNNGTIDLAEKINNLKKQLMSIANN